MTADYRVGAWRCASLARNARALAIANRTDELTFTRKVRLAQLQARRRVESTADG